MKMSLLFISLLASTLCFSQIDFGKQVKKKDVTKGLVTFANTTDTNGNVTYGFIMDGKPVGAQFIIASNGTRTYCNYNTENHIDGTTIVMDGSSGETTLYTYRKNAKEGPAFKLANGKVLWNRQYEKDKATTKEYVVNHSFDYYTQKTNSYIEGFGMDKYKDSYALGYFAYNRRAYPMIHVWNDGDSYYGQYIQGVRKEFGVYFYADGSKYIGAWDSNYKEGLGFKMDKSGNVTEKGFYDNGELKIKL